MNLVISRIEADPRWAAVAARDPAFDGQFVYAVKTTGIYCRPACPARLAKPQNVRFFASSADAELAGFRACRRCHPDADIAPHIKKIADACRALAEAETPPSLADLAAKAGLSAFHFHRVFKSVTGVTPKAYATAHRAERMRRTLTEANSVTEAIYDAGFASSSRFYESSGATLGMTPTAFRKGGADVEIAYAIGACSLGSILVARSARGICAIMLGDDPDVLTGEIKKRFPNARLTDDDDAFAALVDGVIAFVDRPAQGLDLPLDIRGTLFQQKVWQALRAIPPGETASYSEIARRIGAPAAVRAVARACASNEIAVAIPCHRVVRNDGALSGYRWGVARKRALLDKERKG